MSDVFEKLNSKVEELLNNYKRLKEENENLRKELMEAKANCEVKETRIKNLQEELSLKELEIEEIVSKIEKMLE